MATTRAERIRAGLYRFVGFVHSRRDPHYGVCGGEIRAERVGRGDFGWECFCKKCSECDTNGYDTLRECIAETVEWWTDRAKPKGAKR